MDEDLAALDRRLEVEAELPLGAELLVQVRLVQRVRALRPLDAVHRDVRIADEVLAARDAGCADGDADAHVAGDIAAAERVRAVDRIQHAPCDRDSSLRVRVADEHCKLVAAEPGGEILGADGAAQSAARTRRAARRRRRDPTCR